MKRQHEEIEGPGEDQKAKNGCNPAVFAAEATQFGENASKEFCSQFRERLDIVHDERAKVISLSRDITSASKKVIFALHRIKDDPMPEDVAQTVNSQYSLIAAKFAEINKLVGNSTNAFWKYSRQVSMASEELVEAVSFQHWLEKSTIITMEELKEFFKSRSIEVFLHQQDYVSGLFDLTGELMRYGTLNRHRGLDIVALLREFENQVFALRGDHSLAKKIEVFEQSMQKLERTLYVASLRSSEVIN